MSCNDTTAGSPSSIVHSNNKPSYYSDSFRTHGEGVVLRVDASGRECLPPVLCDDVAERLVIDRRARAQSSGLPRPAPSRICAAGDARLRSVARSRPCLLVTPDAAAGGCTYSGMICRSKASPGGEP
nr:hypothetical protein CFP56_74949 [Quercus suber]